MKKGFSRLTLAVTVILAVPTIAAEPQAKEQETEQQQEAVKDTESRTASQAKEEKRICRRVKLDMSSRRGTKVCKTADEWRKFNQRR